MLCKRMANFQKPVSLGIFDYVRPFIMESESKMGLLAVDGILILLFVWFGEHFGYSIGLNAQASRIS